MPKAKQQLLTPKIALKRCYEYLKGLEIKLKQSDLLIEEIEFSEDEQYMFLIISYDIESGFFPERRYRRFKLRMSDGQVLAMKKPEWTKA